ISSEDAAAEFNDMLQGSLRHLDPLTAFNITPPPLFDAVVATTFIQLYNANSCWDFISGKLCLYEKKILRMLGGLVHWPKADGCVVTGGKQAFFYAIKNGAARAGIKSHEMGEGVVICSKLAHYSIEHTCHYLGISAQNCLRVATHSNGETDLQAFEKTIREVISQGKKIAAVIAVGGATINLVPDPIQQMKQVIDLVAKECALNYTPYLHVDSVISWAWLVFQNAETNIWKEQISPKILTKIKSVLSKLQGIQYADSFAADFHKVGFCPYAAGAFIAKETSFLSGMAVDGSSPPEDLSFGEVEIYRHTLENSRPALAIASIWIALRRMGLEGFRKFLLYQFTTCEAFKRKIQERYKDHFEILNDHSKGWEIVIKPHFGFPLSWDQLQKASPSEQKEYTETCYRFLNDLWYGSFNGQPNKTPVIGFVKKYSRKGEHEHPFPAFLIHPCSLHYDDKAIDEMLSSILAAKLSFEEQNLAVSPPAVNEYLCRFVPPR
ncbi:MAG: hypothetical protein FJZ64_04615, partial [Chlamydiae bacterium]|nr:hypothetical protein [Chlamydiota bacterium]